MYLDDAILFDPYPVLPVRGIKSLLTRLGEHGLELFMQLARHGRREKQRFADFLVNVC